jgi:hypothetical protein
MDNKVPRPKALIILVALFSFLLGVAVNTPTENVSSNAKNLDDKIFALTVRAEPDSPWRGVMRSIRNIFPGERSLDQVEASMNALAAARNLVGLANIPGLLLLVPEGSRAWESGFRSSDVVVGAKLHNSGTGRISASILDKNTNKDCIDSQGDWAFDPGFYWLKLEVCDGRVDIIRDGRRLEIEILSGGNGGSRTRPVGGSIIPTFPIALENTYGTSSGLALALHYADSLSTGKLSSKDTVSATGTITPSLRVVQISGAPYKAKAAASVNSTVMFVPGHQDIEIIDYEKMLIFPVNSLKEAVEILCKRGSNDGLCLILEK